MGNIMNWPDDDPYTPGAHMTAIINRKHIYGLANYAPLFDSKEWLIPDEPTLWKMDRFDDFIAARKDLLREKFAFILRPDGFDPARPDDRPWRPVTIEHGVASMITIAATCLAL